VRGSGTLKEAFQDHHIDADVGRNGPVFNGFGREMGYSLLLMTRSSRLSLSHLLAAVLLALTAAGCSPSIEHRGYIAKPGAFNQIDSGMSKLEVEGILGSPSTTASVNFQGDSYYYITSTTKSRAFLTPTETSREVIAIRFDRDDRVQSFAQYGLQDGRVIDLNTRRTVVAGEDTSLITQLLRSAGGARTGPMLGNRL
jgi:outer membrane protein assembly factor BamE (lipoprotein component of BamABCDE complex)